MHGCYAQGDAMTVMLSRRISEQDCPVGRSCWKSALRIANYTSMTLRIIGFAVPSRFLVVYLVT